MILSWFFIGFWYHPCCNIFRCPWGFSDTWLPFYSPSPPHRIPHKLPKLSSLPAPETTKKIHEKPIPKTTQKKSVSVSLASMDDVRLPVKWMNRIGIIVWKWCVLLCVKVAICHCFWCPASSLDSPAICTATAVWSKLPLLYVHSSESQSLLLQAECQTHKKSKTTSPICNVICIQNAYNLYLDTLFVHDLIILVQDMIFVVRVQKSLHQGLSVNPKKRERSGGRRTPDYQLSTDSVSLSLIIMEVQNDHIGRLSTHQTPWFFLSWLWEGRLRWYRIS